MKGKKAETGHSRALLERHRAFWSCGTDIPVDVRGWRVIELSVFALGREVRGNGHWILGGGCSGIIKHSL